ncbi:MAG: HPr family phosphocarrier protein [Bacillota bacterium]
MYEKELTITSKYGLHARPAASFVEQANKFKAEIEILKDGEPANAKSIISLLAIAPGNGDRITIRAEGSDEKKAVQKLASFLKEVE